MKKSTLNPSGVPYEVGPGGLSPERFVNWYRDQSKRCWDLLPGSDVARLIAIIQRARARGNRIFVMGNGGSASTSSHLAADLCKTAAVPGRPLIRCNSLTDNVAFITAAGNDISYDRIFSRQLENELRRDDIVVLISGSGNSRNMLAAARLARERGAVTVGLLGFGGGKLRSLVDLAVVVESRQYGIIEDLHAAIGHIVTFYFWQEPSGRRPRETARPRRAQGAQALDP